MQKSLTVTISPPDERKYQIIQFNGDFDKAGYSEVREELNGTVKKFEGSALVFDFTNLKFINSEGIGYLVEVHTHLVKLGKKLIIAGANDHVKDVFETIGISEMIPLYADLNALLKAI